MDTINTSIDTNSVDKKKISFLPKLLIALSSLFSIVGVGLAFLPNHYKSARAVSYNDEDYTITLSADELNNYHFSNFNNVVIGIYNDVSGILSTGFYCDYTINTGDEYELVSFDIDDGYFGLDEEHFIIEYFYSATPNYHICFNCDLLDATNDDKFYFYADVQYVFEYSLDLVFNSTYYADIKYAIEQDILANQSYTNNTFLQDIIELLVGGIGVTASGIGSGLSVLVSSLAIQNGTMSPFMAIILIFGGIALALALCRWVVNLLSSLGQRNR